MKLPPDVQEFFRKAGQKGGTTAAKKMSKEQRKARAKQAVQARWAKAKKK
jgi:hypothetical protein